MMHKTSRMMICAATFAALSGTGTDVFAQQDTTSKSDGNWSDTGVVPGQPIQPEQTRWDNFEPANTDEQASGEARNAIINYHTIEITQAGETALRVDLGTSPSDPSITGTLNMSSGDLTVSEPTPLPGDPDLRIGVRSRGIMNFTGGRVNVQREVAIGRELTAVGTLNIGGGPVGTTATMDTDVVVLGVFDTSRGVLTVKDGATFGARVFNLANDPNTSAAATQTGGTMNARSHFLIGRLGTATYDHSAGAINVLTGNGDFVIGDLDGAGTGPTTAGRGTYNISGTATVQTSDDFWVGNANETNGRLNQTGGTITVGQTPAVGQDYLVALGGGSTGRVDHSAGGMTTSFLAVGNSGNGTYNLSGTGTVTSRREFLVGRNLTAVGAFTQAGTSTLTAAYGVIGERGAGTYQMNGGTLNIATTAATVGGALPALLLIGRDGGTTNVGTGTLTQTAGAVNVGSATNIGSVFLGDFDDAFGTYRISGGALNITGNLNVASALASNAAADNVRVEPNGTNGAQGQATGVRGRFEVVGSTGDINVGGHLLANPANRSSFRSTPASVAELVFEFVGNAISVIDVGGVADLDGAVIDVDNAVLTPESRVTLIIAQRGLANAGTVDATSGTTENAGTGEMFTLAAEDQGIYRLDVVPFGTAGGEMLQVSAVPEPSGLALLGLGGLGLLRRRRGGRIA